MTDCGSRHYEPIFVSNWVRSLHAKDRRSWQGVGRAIRLEAAMRAALWLTIGGSCLFLGCAERIPPRPAGAPGAALVGWVIMAGDRENPDQDFVCQSSPRDECVLPVSRPDQRAFAHVHLYFHPAAADVRYTGSVQIGFFESAADVNPDVLVNAGGPVGNHSVTGIVTPNAGAHAMTIDVVAAPTAAGSDQQIRERVTVLVK